MRLLCFAVNGAAHLGLKLPDGVLDLTAAGYPQDLTSTIKDFAAAQKEIQSLVTQNRTPLLDAANLSYLAPASDTAKVLCVGLNYRLHIAETSKNFVSKYPKNPVLFSKLHDSLTGHLCPVTLSANATQYDYEAELVVVMGQGGMDIPKEKARDYIFGYTCGNDLSARDLQKMSSQWFLAKSLPGFAPVGPWIVTTDELDPLHLDITCRRGSQIVQSSNTGQMLFDVYDIVSFASKYIRLEPGDLIFTGTPDGVILGLQAGQHNWLTAGEEVTVAIAGIGELTTRFVSPTVKPS